MLNVEFWKDRLKEIGYNRNSIAVVNGVPQLCRDTDCMSCAFFNGEEEYYSCSDLYEWLMKEYEAPETDWRKVPPDTAVMVRSIDSEKWELRKFAVYLPNADPKYYVFGHGHSGMTRENAGSPADMIGWEQCRLVYPEDIGKYGKDEKHER